MDTRRVYNNVSSGVNAANLHQPHINATALIQPGKSFGDALTKAVDSDLSKATGLRFSKHAATRLNSREVDLTPEQLKRVEAGVNAALGKGVSDSLVLVDGYALVVNTISKTVITAMNSSQRNDGVFTNINGAVIV